MDEYSDTPMSVHWTTVMEQSGFERNGKILLDEYDLPIEKDSLGHMRHFRWYGVDEARHALFYGNYKIEGEPKLRVVKGGTWEHPSTERSLGVETLGDPELGFRTVISYYPKENLQWDWPDWRDL